MQACKTIQLIFDIFQKKCACCFWTTCLHVFLYLAWVFESFCYSETTRLFRIACCFQTTSCCLIRAVHIMSNSCNHDHECIIINYVNNCFNNAVYQISQFHQFSQFINCSFSIINISTSCHIFLWDCEDTVRCI